MKKISILIISAAAVLSASCSDYLNQTYRAAISPDAVTAKDLPAMRIGMYESVQNSPTVYEYIAFDITSGYIKSASSTAKSILTGYFNTKSSNISNQWNGLYNALYQVNSVIAAAEKYPEALNSAQTLGEAYYFRAWIYLNLVTRWGDVPIIKVNTMAKVKRNPVSEVYALIDEDLAKARQLLGSSTNYYYVSNDAAVALEARVRLYEGRYTEAAELAESLISKGTYTLDEFSNIFNISRPTNKETIFAFCNKDLAESSINIGDHYFSYAYVNKGQGNYYPTEDLVNMFKEGDKRKATMFITVEGRECMAKYPSGQAGRDPFIVSRIAEMYLISAEAQGYPAGLGRLNELRAKRGVEAAVATDKDSFLTAVLDERLLELFGENHAYYDCIRTGTAEKRIGLLEYQKLFPLPGSEVQLNDLLVQNPGY